MATNKFENAWKASLTGAMYVPIYAVSYVVSDKIVKYFKLHSEYIWVFTALIVLMIGYFTKILPSKDFMVWASIPISVLSYFIAFKTSKDPLTQFLTFIGSGVLLYAVIGVFK